MCFTWGKDLFWCYHRGIEVNNGGWRKGDCALNGGEGGKDQRQSEEEEGKEDGVEWS